MKLSCLVTTFFYKQGIYTYVKHTQTRIRTNLGPEKQEKPLQLKDSTLKFKCIQKQKSWLIRTEQRSSERSSSPLKATTLSWLLSCS